MNNKHVFSYMYIYITKIAIIMRVIINNIKDEM